MENGVRGFYQGGAVGKEALPGPSIWLHIGNNETAWRVHRASRAEGGTLLIYLL